MQSVGEFLSQGLQNLMKDYPQLFSGSRGWGLIQGIVIDSDANLNAIDVVKAAMDNGLLLVPAGPKVIRFVPPLTITADEIQIALDRLKIAIQNLVQV